jgi:hypothetical protein
MQGHDTSFSRGAVELYLAAMFFDHLARQCQPQPKPLAFGGKERLENLVEFLLLHPDPGVGKSQRKALFRVFGANRKRPAVRHSLKGVEHDVVQASADKLRIE